MSARKKGGLGRGLAELLGEAPTSVPRAGIGTAGVTELSVAAIRPNRRQPRRDIEQGPLEELARSIESVGLIQPVIVRASGDSYELIAGERRWRAAQMAGYTLIPAIVREASDTESLELALVENVVRQDLNAMDEAFALQVLMEDLGVTQESLAARVGKSRSAIANKIRLLELAGPVQEMLVDGTLTEGHGRALLGLRSRAEQLRLARKAARNGMSVRAVEAEVRRAIEGEGSPKRAGTAGHGDVPEALLDSVRDGFYGRLAVVPRVRFGRSGGVVEIPFKDEAALRELVERLRSV